MVNIFQSLLLVIAESTQKELARQVKYLKVENQILQARLPQRITCTAKERIRLVKFAQKLGSKVIKQLTTIVHPSTILHWIAAENKNKPKPKKRGRPRALVRLRKLILEMAIRNELGYTRIKTKGAVPGVKTFARSGPIAPRRCTPRSRSTLTNHGPDGCD